MSRTLNGMLILICQRIACNVIKLCTVSHLSAITFSNCENLKSILYVICGVKWQYILQAFFFFFKIVFSEIFKIIRCFFYNLRSKYNRFVSFVKKFCSDLYILDLYIKRYLYLWNFYENTFEQRLRGEDILDMIKVSW